MTDKCGCGTGRHVKGSKGNDGVSVIGVNANLAADKNSFTLDFLMSNGKHYFTDGIPIPEGKPGEDGKDGVNGTNGTNGEAATIAITDTVTLVPGSMANMVELANSTPQNRLYQAQIPRGEKGEVGTGGDGDMKAEVYDPTGKADDAFNHKNHYGNHFLVSTAQQETAGGSEFQVDTAVTSYSIFASNSVSAFPVAISSASITGAVNLSTGNATATMDFSSINGDATPGKVFITVNGQNLPANSVIGTDADFGFTTYPAPPSGGQPGQVLGMGSDGRLAWIDLPTAAKA